MSEEPLSFRTDSFLSDIDDNLLDQLDNRGWEVEGDPGTPVYLADDSANLVYFVRQGRVRLYYPTASERTITLDFLDAGEFFGELALVNFETRGEAAETIDESLLTVIPGDYFRRIMEKSTELFGAVFDFMNVRRWRIQNRLKTLVYEDARKKVIYVLLDFGGGLAQKSRRFEATTVNMTHQELAGLTGLARPTTTKILNQLEDDGLIKLGNAGVEIAEPAKLRQEINEPTD